ncbi:HemK family protein methyltransferase [Candidatus Saccharibacteria bacterium]|nr:HemK family protein methyltransferase [Candidatus Saccharibacteria bacterium]
MDENVLTPRPETEQIIDEVLSLAGKPILPGVKPEKPALNAKGLKILDVGTGSGCITITLKKELEEADIYAVDISEKALEIAKKNAKNLNATITIKKSYLLNNIDFTPDIIVANLPYVDKDWDWLDKESLKEDPGIALYAEDHGLKLIKELIDTANSKYLILEADPSQHQEIINYATSKYQHQKTNGFVLVFSKC